MKAEAEFGDVRVPHNVMHWTNLSDGSDVVDGDGRPYRPDFRREQTCPEVVDLRVGSTTTVILTVRPITTSPTAIFARPSSRASPAVSPSLHPATLSRRSAASEGRGIPLFGSSHSRRKANPVYLQLERFQRLAEPPFLSTHGNMGETRVLSSLSCLADAQSSRLREDQVFTVSPRAMHDV